MASNVFDEPFFSSATQFDSSTDYADAITCSAYKTAAQSIANATVSKILIDATSFDTDSIVDTTNSKIIPTKAGYYSVRSLCTIPSTNAMLMVAYIRKNGINVIEARNNSGRTGDSLSTSLGGIVEMNGSTDYLELYVWQDSGGAVDHDEQARRTFLEVTYIGPA